MIKYLDFADNDIIELNLDSQAIYLIKCEKQNFLIMGNFNKNSVIQHVILENIIFNIHHLERVNRNSLQIELNNEETLLFFFYDFNLILLNGQIAGDDENVYSFMQ